MYPPPASAPRPLACLLLLLVAAASSLPLAEGARRLHQCTASSVAIAGSSSEGSVADAVGQAFSDCKVLRPVGRPW